MTNTGKERIKASIKKKITAYALVAFLSSALLIISQRPSIASLYAKSGHADFMHGFVVGMVIAIEIVCVYQISKYINALKDEKKLIRIYNELNDERLCQIESLSGKSAVEFTAIVLLILALIVSFISFEATIAFLAALTILFITKKSCSIYYTRTYSGE